MGGDHLATSRGWLGQVSDTDTGLIYLNARYYDPVLSRFVSPDPLMNPGDPKTLDPYRYADNTPVMMTDASGLEPRVWEDGRVAGVPVTGSAPKGFTTKPKPPTRTLGPTPGPAPTPPPTWSEREGRNIYGTLAPYGTYGDPGCKWAYSCVEPNDYALWEHATGRAQCHGWASECTQMALESAMMLGSVACLVVTAGACAAIIIPIGAAQIVDGKVNRGWSNAHAVVYGIVVVAPFAVHGIVAGAGSRVPAVRTSGAEDLAIAEAHLGTLEGALAYEPNAAMLQEIRGAIGAGRPLTQAQQAFLDHEVVEAQLVGLGLDQESAHMLIMEHQPVGVNFSPEVLQAHPDKFSKVYFDYWGLDK